MQGSTAREDIIGHVSRSSLSRNPIRSYLKGDNEPKCMHALQRVNKIATLEQKGALGLYRSTPIDARKAAGEVTQANMEIEVGVREKGGKLNSRQKPTVIALGIPFLIILVLHLSLLSCIPNPQTFPVCHHLQINQRS